MGNKKPPKSFPRPKNHFCRVFFDLTSNQRFELFITTCIFLNMIMMCLEKADQSEETEIILNIINHIFVLIFTLECLMKLIALHWRYFKIPWNIFDITIVILSLNAIIFENFMKEAFTFSPTVLRVVRLIRVGRVLRLVEGARGIRTLLFALVISLPALVNIGLLLFLVIFIYAIFGMNLFMYVKYDDQGIDEVFNFENIYRSMITLFPLCTSAGWNKILKTLTNDYPPYCDPNKKTPLSMANGDCGNSMIAIPFLVSYLIISFLVVVNMYIAVILENFTQAREEIREGLTDDDYDMFYEVWQTYDIDGTEFIPYSKLCSFVNALEKPLGIPFPNRLKLISMNLTVCENDQLHCSDILDALTKNFLGTTEDSEQNTKFFFISKKGTNNNYKPYTTTLIMQRKQHCSRTITKALRRFKLKKQCDARNTIKKATIDEFDGEDDENFYSY